MSFGFSISDLIEVSRLTTSLIRRVRTAGAEFREFESDLQLARSVFVSFEENWNTGPWRTTAARLQQNHNAILQATITGIRNGLNDLDHQLETHSQTRFSRFQLSYRLHDLRRRLDFHLGSLQLVMQNLNLVQGRNIEDAMRLIREGQEEQRREDERNRLSMQRSPNEHGWNESLSSFQLRYAPRRTGTASADVESSTSSASRDRVIEQWRQTVPSAVPTHPSPPQSFLGQATTTDSLRVHSGTSQPTSSPGPLPGGATPSHPRRSSDSTAVATQHPQSGSGSNSDQLMPSVHDVPSPEPPTSTFVFVGSLKWAYISTLLAWFATMGLAIAIERTVAGVYGNIQGLGLPYSRSSTFFIFGWVGVMVIFLLFAFRACCCTGGPVLSWSYLFTLGLSLAVVQLAAGIWTMCWLVEDSCYCSGGSDTACSSVCPLVWGFAYTALFGGIMFALVNLASILFLYQT